MSETPTFCVAVDSAVTPRGLTPLGVPSPIRPFGKILAEQPIGIFIRPPLPGTVWITKIDFHLCRDRQLLVCSHFHPSIPRQGTTESDGQAWHVGISAYTTLAVSFPATLTRSVNRDCRSTRVAIWVLFDPDSKSPPSAPEWPDHYWQLAAPGSNYNQ